MDLRGKKTVRSIENAFLKIRSKKSLESITVREVIELAEVGKSTFYLHYKDIYDLCDQIQIKIVRKIFESIRPCDAYYMKPKQFARELYQAFEEHAEISDVVFSGRQNYMLALRVEQGMREWIFREHPDLRENAKFNVWLSYINQGGFLAYTGNKEAFGGERVLEILTELSQKNPPESCFK